jgi:hypothetical protein
MYEYESTYVRTSTCPQSKTGQSPAQSSQFTTWNLLNRITNHKMSTVLDFPLISANMIDIKTMPCKRTRSEESAKTRVRFASVAHLEQIGTTISRFDMTDEEIFSCWWTSEEQETTRRQARVVMKLSMRNLDTKDLSLPRSTYPTRMLLLLSPAPMEN